MIETSWNNHYKLGYGKEWFAGREDPTGKLVISADGCGRVPQSITTESVYATTTMCNKYGVDNITVLYSGGCDSEIILQAFQGSVGNGKMPRIVFLDYDGLNSFDCTNAEKYCRNNDLTLDVINVPIRELINNDRVEELCVKYQCANSGSAIYLDSIEKLCKSSFLVLGDEPYFELFEDPITGIKAWNFIAREWTFSQWKAFHFNGVDGCPNFLQWTAELFTSFMLDPIMQWMFSQSDYTTSNQVKYSLYQQRFFVKPRYKSTGMESLVDSFVGIDSKLHTLGIENDEVHWPYVDMIKQMTRYLPAQYREYEKVTASE